MRPPGLDKIGPESHLGEFAIVRVTVQDIQQEQETGTLVQAECLISRMGAFYTNFSIPTPDSRIPFRQVEILTSERVRSTLTSVQPLPKFLFSVNLSPSCLLLVFLVF